MGGDGGVVATNRRYMRGAGTADHTGDAKKSSCAEIAERDTIQQAMTQCAITGTPFDFSSYHNNPIPNTNTTEKSSVIVACPFGKLYYREAAIEALLRRAEQQQQHHTNPDIGWHVRGMKDLYPVYFHVVKRLESMDDNKYVPVCPITNIELNGIQPAYLIVKTNHKSKTKKSSSSSSKSNDENNNHVNVISDKALKEMGINSLQEEYGPFLKEDLIRLAPPSGAVMDEIQKNLENRRESEKVNNKQKSSKKDGKRKSSSSKKDDGVKSSLIINGNSSDTILLKNEKRLKTTDHTASKPIDNIRTNLSAAVASNKVLSSLFEDKRSKNISEKEKKDNLFVR